MIKDKKASSFGDTMGAGLTLEGANAIRKAIRNSTHGHWIYVHNDPNKAGKYSVSCQNTWGGPLTREELAEIKSAVKNSKDNSAKTDKSTDSVNPTAN